MARGEATDVCRCPNVPTEVGEEVANPHGEETGAHGFDNLIRPGGHVEVPRGRGPHVPR